MTEEAFRCKRCGANRFVSVSLTKGCTRVPQCVPCGAYQSDYYGHGWRSPNRDIGGWVKRQEADQ